MGAGIGAFLNTMKKRGWEISGIEPDAGARQQAKQLFDIELSSIDHLHLCIGFQKSLVINKICFGCIIFYDSL